MCIRDRVSIVATTLETPWHKQSNVRTRTHHIRHTVSQDNTTHEQSQETQPTNSITTAPGHTCVYALGKQAIANATHMKRMCTCNGRAHERALALSLIHI
eukprot:3627301-Alexandrium_andersonii.AAC.1